MTMLGIVLKIMGFMNAGLFCLFPFYVVYFAVRTAKARGLTPGTGPLIDTLLIYSLFALGFISPSVMPLNTGIGLRGLFVDFSGFLLIVTIVAPPQLLAAIYLDDKRFKEAIVPPPLGGMETG
jgi:hypothetical protein